VEPFALLTTGDVRQLKGLAHEEATKYIAVNVTFLEVVIEGADEEKRRLLSYVLLE